VCAAAERKRAPEGERAERIEREKLDQQRDVLPALWPISRWCTEENGGKAFAKASGRAEIRRSFDSRKESEIN
jgi:hypothetical protein